MRLFIYECVCAGGLGREAPSSLQREGWAMLSSIVADFQRIPGIEIVTLLDEALPQDLGDICTHIPSEEEWRAFPDIAARCEWTLVIAPEFDDLLRDRSQAALDAGSGLLGSSPSAIELTGDKLATADFWREQNVPHPRTQLLDPRGGVSFPGPCVMKPRHGAGSQATFLIRNPFDQQNAWSPAFHECPDDEFIVQPFIPGQSASIALLIGPTQTIPLLPARQHLSRDGRFRYEGGSLPLPEPLASRATKLALQAVKGIDGLQGFVGVDLVLGNDGNDHAIEINPRLTTSYLGLRKVCQLNLAELTLRLAQGETVAPPTWKAGEVRFGPRIDLI